MSWTEIEKCKWCGSVFTTHDAWACGETYIFPCRTRVYYDCRAIPHEQRDPPKWDRGDKCGDTPLDEDGEPLKEVANERTPTNEDASGVAGDR